MFGFIGSTIGKIFGTDKALKSVVDGVSSGLDKLVYTKEEKADNALKLKQEAGSFIIEWMKATTGQNVARRIIALSIVFTWLFLYLTKTFTLVSAVFLDSSAMKLKEVAQLIGESADGMNSAVVMILAFYFAARSLPEIVGKFKKS